MVVKGIYFQPVNTFLKTLSENWGISQEVHELQCEVWFCSDTLQTINNKNIKYYPLLQGHSSLGKMFSFSILTPLKSCESYPNSLQIVEAITLET